MIGELPISDTDLWCIIFLVRMGGRASITGGMPNEILYGGHSAATADIAMKPEQDLHNQQHENALGSIDDDGSTGERQFPDAWVIVFGNQNPDAHSYADHQIECTHQQQP